MGSAVMRQLIVIGAGVLFAAGIRRKLQVSSGFMAAIGSWGVVPPARVRMVARSLVFLEGALAAMAFAALSVPALWAVTVAASAGLLGVFAVGQMAIAQRSRAARCGCFGAGGRVGVGSVVRTSTLAAVFAAVLVLGGWLP
jgi:hypothetical protein